MIEESQIEDSTVKRPARGIAANYQAPTVTSADGPGSGAASGDTLRDHGGKVLINARLKLVFWGTGWFHFSQHPSTVDIIWAIKTILHGPFMDGLRQYRGMGKATLIGDATFVNLFVDPPNPFTQADIEQMITSLIDGGQVPATSTDQLLCCVFTPAGFSSDDALANGYHSSLSHNSRTVPYLWCKDGGSLGFVSSIFSHELAEACTNPTGLGIFASDGSCGQGGECEISDYCYGFQEGRGTEKIGGALVQAYWSLADGGCILPQEPFVRGNVSGNPSLIQGRFLHRGNFELVTPLASGGLAHYSRVNDDPALFWSGPVIFGTDVGHFDSVSLIQSNFISGGRVGNLEVVAHFQGVLVHYWREDLPPFRWHGPTLIPSAPPGQNSQTIRGNPALIQGRFGKRGNFELVTPLAAGGLGHYWRDNDNGDLPWSGPAIFGENVGIFDAVTMVQSDFSAGGRVGNLEVVARANGQLLHYWREDIPPFRWFGPSLIPLSEPNENSRNASGVPSLVFKHFNQDFKGFFQLVTPLASGGFAHYTRDNNIQGLPWRGSTILATELGQIDAISMIQSNFSDAFAGPGNLETILRFESQLFHHWRGDFTPIASPSDFRTWFGPWVVTR